MAYIYIYIHCLFPYSSFRASLALGPSLFLSCQGKESCQEFLSGILGEGGRVGDWREGRGLGSQRSAFLCCAWLSSGVSVWQPLPSVDLRTRSPSAVLSEALGRPLSMWGSAGRKPRRPKSSWLLGLMLVRCDFPGELRTTSGHGTDGARG